MTQNDFLSLFDQVCQSDVLLMYQYLFRQILKLYQRTNVTLYLHGHIHTKHGCAKEMGFCFIKTHILHDN